MSMNKFYSVSFDETNKEFSVRTFADEGPYVHIVQYEAHSKTYKNRIETEKKFKTNTVPKDNDDPYFEDHPDEKWKIAAGPCKTKKELAEAWKKVANKYPSKK